MPIYAPHETLSVLGEDSVPRCESRSLFKDRYADPQARDEGGNTPRKDWFKKLVRRRAGRPANASWLPSNSIQLYARLMSRLMVDLSGGVMENANVNLDRYGLPVIPGSAVKGCARRMALQALHDWIAAGTERPTDDDACAPRCEGFVSPADMLAAIARIFGWVEVDWDIKKKDECWTSDFAWAVNGNEHILAEAQDKNLQCKDFAGTIAFLPAAPNRDPGLELDVLTPHHSEYYKSTDLKAAATDTEDPIPHYFPAVKPQGDGDYFTFALIPLRRAVDEDISHAKRWLSYGLELFGIGAKTNAGYGWFQDVTNEVELKMHQLARLNELENEFLGFDSWTNDQKEDAILKLADRREDCLLWSKSSPDSFAPISRYAESLSITLL